MAEAKTIPPGRMVVLNAVLAVFISCVVFAVIALVVLVPQMARQEVEIRELRAGLVAMQGALAETVARSEAAHPPAPSAAPGAAAPGSAPAGAAAPPAAPGK